MCLFHITQLKNDEDLTCYKVLLIRKKTLKTKGFFSPFKQEYEWEFGKTYENSDKEDVRTAHSHGDVLVQNAFGGFFHSFKHGYQATKLAAFMATRALCYEGIGIAVCKCTIPKEAIVYKGFTETGWQISPDVDGYASTKLRVDQIVVNYRFKKEDQSKYGEFDPTEKVYHKMLKRSTVKLIKNQYEEE